MPQPVLQGAGPGTAGGAAREGTSLTRGPGPSARPATRAGLLGALLLFGLAPPGLAQTGVTRPGSVQPGVTRTGLRLTSVGGTVEIRSGGSSGPARSGLTGTPPSPAPRSPALKSPVPSAPQDDRWQLARAGQTITTGLRTGTGRAGVSIPQGTLTLGAASTLALNRGEPDLLSGRFLLSSQQDGARVFVRGTHLAVLGRARLDLTDSLQRLAVLEGSVRVAAGNTIRTVTAGQSLNLTSGQLSAFAENDPWYDSRFEGLGDAQVQATLGTVETGDASADGNWRPSVIGATLGQGARVRTGSGAWAELGFSGGGYLRLQERSRLRVLGIEKTSAGREVLLQLEAGSAWNVVQKKAGGYQLSTPTVTTAVRGTVFRVDADGVVKVFDGAVALPGQGDALLGVGQQRAVGGAQGPLTPDLLDKFNLALDADRARPTDLQALLPPEVQRLRLSVTSNSGARLSAQLTPVPAADGPRNNGTQNGAQAAPTLRYVLTPAEQPGAGSLSLTPPSQSTFTLDALPPEGRYILEVRATRYGQQVVRSQPLRVDRTPPQLQLRQVLALGDGFIVTGHVSDDSGEPPLLSAAVSGAASQAQAQLRVSGDFVWVLPRPAHTSAADLLISAEDPAGNVTRAALP